MVHVGGSGDYPQAQLEALDSLIAYIDTHYGFESEIIYQKAWREKYPFGKHDCRARRHQGSA